MKRQYRCESLVERAKGYGMEGVYASMANILSVLDTIKGNAIIASANRNHTSWSV